MKNRSLAGPVPAFRFSAFGLLAAAALALGLGPVMDGSQEVRAELFRHLALRSSVPAADATVGEAPDEVRLVFTEAPQVEGTSIRIADGMNELVASTEAVADGEDPRQVFIRPEGVLSPGNYRVHWRAIAQDGHAVNGDFGFQITTE